MASHLADSAGKGGHMAAPSQIGVAGGVGWGAAHIWEGVPPMDIGLREGLEMPPQLSLFTKEGTL